MPDPTAKWEVDVKRDVKRIEIDLDGLNVTLWADAGIIKQGTITETDFNKVKDVVKKILTET